MSEPILEPGWERDNVLWMIPNRLGPAKLYRYFNVNYYPENVEPLLDAAEDRWMLVVSCALSMPKQVQIDTQEFLKILKQHVAVGPRNVPTDWACIAVYQSPTWLSMFHGFLVSLKSLLDIMGTTWATVADPRTSAKGFHKGKVGGRLLAGGSLVNWFRASCPRRFSAREQAAQVIEEHSNRWITEAVAHRDTLVHKGAIGELTPLAVRLDIRKANPSARTGDYRQVYRANEVAVPRMSDGTTAMDYCQTTAANAERLLLEMTKLFASDKPRVPPGPPEPGDRMVVAEHLLKKDGGECEGSI